MSQDGPSCNPEPNTRSGLFLKFAHRLNSLSLDLPMISSCILACLLRLARWPSRSTSAIDPWTYGRPSPLPSRRLQSSSSRPSGERLDPDPRDELLMGPRPIPQGLMTDPTSSSRSSPVQTCPRSQNLTRAKLAGEAARVSHNTTGTMWLERNEVVKGWSKVQSRSIRSLNHQSPGILWGCVVAGL